MQRFFRTENGVVPVTREMLDVSGRRRCASCRSVRRSIAAEDRWPKPTSPPPPHCPARAGCEPRVLLPGFPAITRQSSPTRGRSPACRAERAGGDRCATLLGRLPTCDVGRRSVIDAPACYARDGGPYADADHQPYADNHLRFSALARWTGAALARGAGPGLAAARSIRPDWHAALARLPAAPPPGRRRTPARLRHTVAQPRLPGLVRCVAVCRPTLPLPALLLDAGARVPRPGQLAAKAGLSSDRITTVSRATPAEIQGAGAGCGLDGSVARAPMSCPGILSRVDSAVWNPATDTLLAARCDATRLAGKARCRKALRAELGPRRQRRWPLCVLRGQPAPPSRKGLHPVITGPAGDRQGGGQFALLQERRCCARGCVRRRHAAGPAGRGRANTRLRRGFAHRLIAGSDVILRPSRFEPCSLTQPTA